MNIWLLKNKLSFLYSKAKTRKRVMVCLLVILSAAGCYGYYYWKNKTNDREATIKAFIIMSHCAVAITAGAEKLGYKDTPESCVKDGYDSIRVYDKIKDTDQKFKFLVDICRSGTHSLMSEDFCKERVWKAYFQK